MKGAEMARIWSAWAEEPGIDGWVWDGAGGHKGADVQAIGAPQVVQPPYAPELNPVERFFQELRRALGNRVYPTLEAKKAALEPILRDWQADPARVRQTVRLGVDPGHSGGPARRHTNCITKLDWYYIRSYRG